MSQDALSAQSFFRETLTLKDPAAVEARAEAFVRALAKNARKEAEVVVADPGLSRLRSAMLKSALSTQVDLAIGRRQCVSSTEACFVAVRDKIAKERATSPAERQKDWMIADAANEFCCFANKNRPTAEETVRICASLIKQERRSSE